MNIWNNLNIIVDINKQNVLELQKNSLYLIQMFQLNDDEMLELLLMNLIYYYLVTILKDMISTMKREMKVNVSKFRKSSVMVNCIFVMLIRKLHAKAASIYVVRMVLTSATLWSLAKERLYRVLNEPS